MQLSLPMEAEKLIPHRLPIRQVERLLEFRDHSGVVEAVVNPENPLLDGNGFLDEVGLIEMLAQSFAAVQGYADRLAGKPVGDGFLVGIRKVAVDVMPRRGDRLTICIRPVGGLESFVVVDGEVRRGEELLASGNLKLWIPPEGVAKENG
ncbi:MAG: 3-hydroxyacyl-ACP dehydratase [Nitrospirota bacterium]|nr:3-hydroxyacyl-ACP dehydratase [Nitrospirota bacterium]